MSANKKELSQLFVSQAKTELGLKKTRPITGFDASFEGSYGKFDVTLSVEEYMDRNDPSTVVQMTWKAGSQGISFEDDFLDHRERALRFSAYRLTFDPSGMYQEDRTALGSRVVYDGNFQNTVKKMHRLVTRELNLNENTMKLSRRKLKRIIREETKKAVNEMQQRRILNGRSFRKYLKGKKIKDTAVTRRGLNQWEIHFPNNERLLIKNPDEVLFNDQS
jgi:hypothetical protein